MTSSVAVIGAGLIGTTTAWYLAERGFDVTVLDRREGPALETSYANGGLLTPSEADPWNAPGTLGRLLRWLGREDSPLLLRPAALPGMLRWGIDFLRASRPVPHRHSTEAILRLALYSIHALNELRHQLNLDYAALSNGTVKIFRDYRALEQSLELAEALRPLGLESHPLKPSAAAALEPLLSVIADQLAGAIHYPADQSGDAHLFTLEMAKHAATAGVKFRFNTSVQAIHADGARIGGLITQQDEIHADIYVLAAGSYSPLLVRPLKLRLPIYPVKGYSVTIAPAQGHSLRVPVVDSEQKLVLTPLGDRLRIAGTAEFNGYDITLNTARSGSILRQAMAILPGLAGPVGQGGAISWTGLRPMTCDGPPVLGEAPYGNLFFNTGHGPLGWTLCAGSARIVADAIAGRAPDIDPGAYRFSRFMR